MYTGYKNGAEAENFYLPKVRDVIEGYEDREVRISGKGSLSDTDPLCWKIWEGRANEVPAEVLNMVVVCESFSLSSNIECIEVYDKKGSFL